MLGIAAGVSEKIGLKAVKNSLLAGINSKAGATLIKILGSAGREGATEWFQYGLEEARRVGAKPNSTVEEMSEAFSAALTSKQGIKAFLYGAVATLGIGASGRLLRNAGESAKLGIESLKKMSSLIEDREKFEEGSVERAAIDAAIDDAAERVIQSVEESKKDDAKIEALSLNDKVKLERLQSQLVDVRQTSENPELSNESKAELDAKASKLQEQITELIEPKVDETTSVLGEPSVSTVEDGELYEWKSKDGLVAGVMVSPTEFRIDGISASEVGQGQGSTMFNELVSYLKNKGVTTITTDSAGEGAKSMHQKAISAGLITRVSEEGRNATFEIVGSQAPELNLQGLGEEQAYRAAVAEAERLGLKGSEKATFVGEKQREWEKANTEVSMPTIEQVTPEVLQIQERVPQEVPTNIIAAFRQGEEGIAARKEVALQNFKNSLKTLNSGFNPETIGHILEYAVLSLAEGSIKTAKQLAKALNLEQTPELDKIFEDASKMNEQYQQFVVEPPKKTIKQRIKSATEGGTTGEVTMTTRQALKKQFSDFNRGIKEGLKQARENQTVKDSDLKQARADLLKMVKTGFKGLRGVKVPVATMERLASIISKADTISKIDKAVQTVQRVVDNVNYIKDLDDTRALQRTVAAIAKRKGMPKELAQTFKELAKLQARNFESSDLKLLQDTLTEAKNLFTDENAALSKSTIDKLTGKVKNMTTALVRLQGIIRKSNVETLKQNLLDAGVDEGLIDAITKSGNEESIFQAMANELQIDLTEDAEIKIVESKKDKMRKLLKIMTTNIDSEFFDEILTPKEKAVLQALDGMHVEDLSDKNLFMAVAGLRNLQVNGRLSNMGSVYANVLASNALRNSSRFEDFLKSIRVPSIIGSKIVEMLASGTRRIAQVTASDISAEKVLGFIGFTDYTIGQAKTLKKLTSAKEEILKVYKKYQKQIDNPKQQITMAVYADLAQHREGWTDEQIADEFEGRKQALKESIDRLDKEFVKSKVARKTSSEYLKNLKEVYEQIKDLKSADEVKGLLNEGQTRLYEAMRSQFDSIKPEMDYMSSMYGQASYEGDWINYFPRSYEKVGATAKEIANLDSATQAVPSFSMNPQMNQTRGNKTGAVQGRVLTGDQVRQGHVVSYNALNNFFNTFNSSVYDINTIEARNYVAEILRSEKLVEGTQERLPLKILESIYVDKVNGDLNSLRTGGSTNLVKEFISGIQTLAATQALGGLGQAIKQGLPTLADTYLRLQSNPEYHMFNAIRYLTTNPEEVAELLDNTAVSRRSVKKIVMPSQDSFKIQQKTIAKSLGKIGIIGAKAGRLAQDIAMASLEFGDSMSAKVAWLSFYMEGYETINGEGSFKIGSELDKTALTYANQKVNSLANESDSSMKSAVSKNAFYSVFLPFASFAINSHLELAQNLARLRDGLTNENSTDYKEVVHNVAGNLAAVVSFHSIAYALRTVAIKFSGVAAASILGSGLFATGNDDEEEKKRKQKVLDLLAQKTQEKLEMNDINSLVYFSQDAFWRGLSSGIMGDVTKPLTTEALYQMGLYTDSEKERLDKAAANSKPFEKDWLDKAANKIQVIGMMGIPFKNANDVRNTVKDAFDEDFDKYQFQMNRFGQESASGLNAFVPEDKKNITLDESLKKMRNIEMAGAVGSFLVPLQEVSTAVRSLRAFDRAVRDAVYGKKKEDREESLNLLNTYVKITVDKEEYMLDAEQLDFALTEHQRVYQEVYKEIKSEMKSDELKDSESEKKIASIIKEQVKAAVLDKYFENLKPEGVDKEERMRDMKIQIKNFIKSKKEK